jgi:hypothetical protein
MVCVYNRLSIDELLCFFDPWTVLMKFRMFKMLVNTRIRPFFLSFVIPQFFHSPKLDPQSKNLCLGFHLLVMGKVLQLL